MREEPFLIVERGHPTDADLAALTAVLLAALQPPVPARKPPASARELPAPTGELLVLRPRAAAFAGALSWRAAD